MEDEQTQEAVLQYLSGKMNETEQRLFEQKLEDDPELAGAYRFQGQVYHGAALSFQKEKKQLQAATAGRGSAAQIFQA